MLRGLVRGTTEVQDRAKTRGELRGLGSVRAGPVEPACEQGQRALEEPAIGGPEGPLANRRCSVVKAKICNVESGEHLGTMTIGISGISQDGSG